MKLSRRTLLTGAMASPVALQAASRLNLIHIGVDTWGAHWLGCYGARQIRTPSVDALASRSAVFADAYPEVLPTIPCRRSIYTGRRVFPSDLILQRDDQVKIRGWHQLYAEDVTLSETLRAAGYTTAIISDLYHQFKPDKNFHRGFDSWRWIRGQESDRLETGPRKAIHLENYLHASQAAQRNNRGGAMQYLLNRREWKSEEDWLPARVFREAARWLDNNAEENQPFYLHIESFSPHEFWDPPEEYYRQYMKGNYKGPRLIAPPLTTKDMMPIEVEHARALYAGLAAFVDACMGKFLRRVDALGLMKNTVVVFAADHGTMMGEQNQLHKGETRLRAQVTHVPLFVYHPRRQWEGRRVRGFVQLTDLMPTVLELLEVKAPARVTGESLTPLIESRRDSSRERIVTGWGEHASVRTPEWNYIGRWSEGKPFEELYDLKRDPDELENIAERNPTLVKDFRAKLKQHVEAGWPATKGTFAQALA
jgi:arylsulfatase A-like enzyme